MDKMRVTVENFGAVKQGTFELKPLTVFIGHNNTGKTWTAYGIASIFGAGSWRTYTKKFLEGELDEKYPEIDTFIETLFSKGNANFDIVTFFKDRGTSYFNNHARLLPLRLDKIIGASNDLFENLSVTVSEDSEPKSAITELLNESIDIKFSPDEDGQPIISIHKEEQDPLIYFYISEDRKEELPTKLLIKAIYEFIFQHIHRSLYHNVRYLPVERTGFVALLASGAMVVNTQKNDSIIAQDNNDSTSLYNIITMPLSSMVTLLSIMTKPLNFSSTVKKRINDKNLQKYVDLAVFFENEIMGGTLEYAEDKINEGTSNLCYRFKENNGTLLELPVVSSAVKELTPLSVYLKCYLHDNDLLVIDEPEVNLHPLAQAQFAEFIGMMVNTGLNVIITTHSPYIVDHLSNLIRADSKATNENVQDLESLFYLKKRNSFLSQDKVGIYLFENKQIKSILRKDASIDWGTFSRISEKLITIDNDMDDMDGV